VVLVALWGCAEHHPGMSPPYERIPATNPALASAVRVSPVRGGGVPSPLEPPQITNTDVEKALVVSLRLGGLLATPPEVARYALDADVIQVDQRTRFDDEVPTALQDVLHPLSMHDYVVTTTIDYALTDTRTGAPLLHLRVESPYIAWMADSPDTSNRYRVANEGSVRESIQTLLDTVAALRVPADERPSSAAPPPGADPQPQPGDELPPGYQDLP
jgi:hypothetical protein